MRRIAAEKAYDKGKIKRSVRAAPRITVADAVSPETPAEDPQHRSVSLGKWQVV